MQKKNSEFTLGKRSKQEENIRMKSRDGGIKEEEEEAEVKKIEDEKGHREFAPTVVFTKSSSNGFDVLSRAQESCRFALALEAHTILTVHIYIFIYIYTHEFA